MLTKKASLTNNVYEFKPGQFVIRVFPTIVPTYGVVTGVSKVENKVYVSWNGRVRQHDPEEIQLVAHTPFFNMSNDRVASVESKKQAFFKLAAANAVSIESLSSAGFDDIEAEDLAASYNRTFQAALNHDPYADLAIVCGEPVVVLNNGGRGPGVVGLLVNVDGCDGIVDITTAWSSAAGQKLVRVPLCCLAPILTAGRAASLKKANYDNVFKLVHRRPEKTLAVSNKLFLSLLGNVKHVFVNGDNGRVETSILFKQPDKNGCIKAVISAYAQDEEVKPKMLFLDKIEISSSEEQDVENAIEKIKTVYENAKTKAREYIRNNISPKTREDNYKKNGTSK